MPAALVEAALSALAVLTLVHLHALARASYAVALAFCSVIPEETARAAVARWRLPSNPVLYGLGFALAEMAGGRLIGAPAPGPDPGAVLIGYLFILDLHLFPSIIVVEGVRRRSPPLVSLAACFHMAFNLIGSLHPVTPMTWAMDCLLFILLSAVALPLRPLPALDPLGPFGNRRFP